MRAVLKPARSLKIWFKREAKLCLFVLHLVNRPYFFEFVVADVE